MNGAADRRAQIALAVLTFMIVGLFFVPLEWRIFDPSMYYAYVRSPLIDGDLDFANEAEPQEWWLSHVERTETGKFPNVYSVGPALFWTPATLLAHGTVRIGQQGGLGFAGDGYDWPYLVLAGLTTVLAIFVGLLVAYRLCRRVAAPFPALLTTVLFWLGTPLLFFGARFTLMSHGFSFALVALFLWTWLRLREQERPSPWSWLFLGLLSGLMMLQRWQNALVLLVPLGGDLLERRIDRERWKGYGLWGLGTLAAFSPQMFMWQVLYGRPLLVPQGESFFHWTRPALGATLFSTNRGLFLWTPLFLLGAAGLVWLWRSDRSLAIPIVVICILETYMNSAIWDWWGGGAFGPRRFLNLLPLLAPGVAGLLARWGRPRWGKVLLLLLAMLLIWQQWAWMDMVFYVEYGDGGHPLSPDVYAQRYGDGAPWSADHYRDHLLAGRSVPAQFYMALYDQGLPLPWSVLGNASYRSLRDPLSLLRPRISRWSSQLPPFFELAQRFEGGVVRAMASWPTVALAVTAIGLVVVLWLWSVLSRREEQAASPRSAFWMGPALLLVLFLLILLVDVAVLLLA